MTNKKRSKYYRVNIQSILALACGDYGPVFLMHICKMRVKFNQEDIVTASGDTRESHGSVFYSSVTHVTVL